MNRYEILAIKKAECQRIDAFKLWRWRRLLRVPWIARRSNQSILKQINPEYSLEGLMLKLQYYGHLMQRVDSLEKTLRMGKTESKRRGWQRMRWLNSNTDSMDMNLSKLWDGEPQSAAGHAVAKSQTWLSDWITTVPALGHFYVSWYISKSGTAGSYGSLIFSFMRKFHAVFDSGCTNLHSH